MATLPPPPTVQQVMQLIPASLQYKAGTGGLKVVAAPGGVIVAMFNADGIQRRFDSRAKQWIQHTLLPNYPGLSQAAAIHRGTQSSSVNTVFGAEGERERLALGMRSRLKTVVDAPPGAFVGLESLDSDTSRQIPTDPSKITPADHKSLPRHVTWVQLEPPPPRRYIALSEKSMQVQGQRKRPDEVFVSYEIMDDELNKISVETTGANGEKIRVDNGTSFKSLSEVDAKNLTIHVGDPNLEISEEAARKHFTKTMSYMQATLESLLKGNAGMPRIRLPPGAKVFLSARDVYMSHAFLKLSSVGPHVSRWAKNLSGLLDGKAIRDLPQNSVIHFEVVMERVNGIWEASKNATDVRGRLAKSTFGLLGTLKRTVTPQVIDEVTNTLKAHAK